MVTRQSHSIRCLLALLSAVLVVRSSNIISNGGFESGQLAPWGCTVTTYCGVDAAGNGHLQASGNHSAFIATGETTRAALYQNTSARAGTNYILMFSAYEINQAATTILQVFLSPSSAPNWTSTTGEAQFVTLWEGTNTSGPYFPFQLAFRAGGNDVLSFVPYTPSDAMIRIDDVILAPTPQNAMTTHGLIAGCAVAGVVALTAVGIAAALLRRWPRQQLKPPVIESVLASVDIEKRTSPPGIPPGATIESGVERNSSLRYGLAPLESGHQPMRFPSPESSAGSTAHAPILPRAWSGTRGLSGEQVPVPELMRMETPEGRWDPWRRDTYTPYQSGQ